MHVELWQELAKAVNNRTQMAVITLIRTVGSTPRPTGAKMLLYADGTFAGTIGGGALEGRLLDEAGNALAEGAPRLVQLDLKGDLDMTCGGRVEAFIEVFGIAQPVWIFGAGHVSRALAPMLVQTGFAVTVVDDRPEWANPEAFPSQVDVKVADFEEACHAVAKPEEAYVVVMTRDHKNDFPVVRHFLHRWPKYMGVMASRSTRAALQQKLKADGLALPEEGFHMPIGLSIGSKTPEEIAVSITAELIQFRSKNRKESRSPSTHE